MTPDVQHEGLDVLSRSIVGWLGSAVAVTECAVVAPDDAGPPEGLALRLVDAEPVPVLHNDDRSPVVLRVRYLVTAASADALGAHRLFGEVVFAAVHEGARAGVSLAGPEDGRSAAARLGLRPGLHILLEARFARARAHAAAPPVRHPITIISHPLRSGSASASREAVHAPAADGD